MLNAARRCSHLALNRSLLVIAEMGWGLRPRRGAVAITVVPGLARISSIMPSYQRRAVETLGLVSGLASLTSAKKSEGSSAFMALAPAGGRGFRATTTA